MKKTISYKTLIAGALMYILCGLILAYLMGVFDVLANQEAVEKNIDEWFTDASDHVLRLFLFSKLGGFTVVFWSVFLYCNRKTNFLKVRSIWIPLISIFIKSYVSEAVAVHDNFMPYYNGFPTLEFWFYPCLMLTAINYVAFLITAFIAYKLSSDVKGQEAK